MPLQIANPVVVAKVEKLARERGMTKTALVEEAVDLLASRYRRTDDFRRRLDAILREADRIPKLPNPIEPLEWDENGLPI
jgi:antitoxin VapB